MGEQVYTIGHPMDFKYSVTSGIVSALREINKIKFIQIDAPINPGNSGGPLLNSKGEVIGINTFKISKAENLNFALAINQIKWIFSLPLLGTRGYALSQLSNEERNKIQKELGIQHGYLVAYIMDGSPVQKAGIEVNDVITYLDGQLYTDWEVYHRIRMDKGVGGYIRVTFIKRDLKKTFETWIQLVRLIDIE